MNCEFHEFVWPNQIIEAAKGSVAWANDNTAWRREAVAYERLQIWFCAAPTALPGRERGLQAKQFVLW